MAGAPGCFRVCPRACVCNTLALLWCEAWRRVLSYWGGRAYTENYNCLRLLRVWWNAPGIAVLPAWARGDTGRARAKLRRSLSGGRWFRLSVDSHQSAHSAFGGFSHLRICPLVRVLYVLAMPHNGGNRAERDGRPAGRNEGRKRPEWQRYLASLTRRKPKR